jgi:hypothetical protein
VNAIEVLQVFLYAGLFAALILHLRFFRKFFVDTRLIAAVFLLKVAVGVIYTLIYRYYYKGGDSLEYFESSKLITRLFIEQDYRTFLRLTFGINTRPPDPDIKEIAFALSYWNDMSAYFLIRFHALASILSFGNFFVHIVFFNWLTMIGLLYLFRFFYEQLKAKKPLVFAAVFFVPSVLFWSSGIHKDGFSMAALGLILFSASKLFVFRRKNEPGGVLNDSGRKHNLSNGLLFITGCWLLIIERNYWMMLLAPSLVSWIWTANQPRLKWLKFAGVHTVYYAVTCNLDGILPQWDFLNLLTLKQRDFMSVASGSGAEMVYVHPLDGTIGSVISAIPTAIYNCLLQPHFFRIGSIMQILVAIENMLVLFSLIIAAVFIVKRAGDPERSLILLCLFFSFSIFAVVGITVPILGALVRYKIPGLVFLLIVAVTLVNHQRIFERLMPAFPPGEKK